MKNKKGFTIIELGVSICLVTVVSFLLFEMITTIKKLHNANDLKTTLLTKQAIMVKKINDDFDKKTIASISNCESWQNSCLKFNFADGSSNNLIVDPLRHTISYNNYVIDYEEIGDDITFGELMFIKNTDFFTIDIPITSSTISGEYGINIIRQNMNTITKNYSETNSTITVPLSNKDGVNTVTTITYDGTNYWLKIYDVNDDNLNKIMANELKHLKLDTCSNASLGGKIYELKTETNSSRWCQTNNMYTQQVGDYKNVSGTIYTALGKDTYIEATKSANLNTTTIFLKVNAFINQYTFKAR